VSNPLTAAKSLSTHVPQLAASQDAEGKVAILTVSDSFNWCWP
jgi:hypothetical protein